MQRSPLRTALLVALATTTLFLAACGGGDDNKTASGGSSSSSTTSTTEATGGTGKGTFVLGDRTFTFDATTCVATKGKVEAAGKGTFDNRPFTVTVRHSESPTSAIETVQVVFTATEAMVGTNFVPLPSGADQVKIKVAGKGKAEGTMPVTGSGGQPSGDGQVTLECQG